MLNKRIKYGIQKIKKPTKQIKPSLGAIALISVCFMLLIVTTFTQVKFNYSFPNMDINIEYIPQIPVVIFIAALLGKKWGMLTILLYILTGIFFYPIFGLGGGPLYIFQYSFGYILAYFFAVFFAANELKKEGAFLPIVLAVLKNVLLIHITGIIYMTIIALLRNDSWSFIYDLIYYQSLSKILYDIICSFAAILIAKCLKKMLWIIL